MFEELSILVSLSNDIFFAAGSFLFIAAALFIVIDFGINRAIKDHVFHIAFTVSAILIAVSGYGASESQQFIILICQAIFFACYCAQYLYSSIMKDIEIIHPLAEDQDNSLAIKGG